MFAQLCLEEDTKTPRLPDNDPNLNPEPTPQDTLKTVIDLLPKRDHQAQVISHKLNQIRMLESLITFIEKNGPDKNVLAVLNFENNLTYVSKSIPSLESLESTSLNKDKILNDLRVLKSSIATESWDDVRTWMASNIGAITALLNMEELGPLGLPLALLVRYMLASKVVDENSQATVLKMSELDTLARALVQAPAILTKLAKLRIPTNSTELLRLKLDIAVTVSPLIYIGIQFDPSGVLMLKDLPVPHAGTLKALGYRNDSLNIIASNLKSSISAMKSEQSGFLIFVKGLNKKIADFSASADNIQSSSKYTDEQKRIALEGSALVMDTIMTTLSRFTLAVKLGIDNCKVLAPLYSGLVLDPHE